MATVELASVQHATVSKELSLHDVRLLISEHLDIEARFVQAKPILFTISAPTFSTASS
jgi:hypothetical protein